MKNIGIPEWKAIFAAWAKIMKSNALYLIELDGIAGDSDLGLTMADGFAAADKTAAAFSGTDIGLLVYHAGKAIMSNAPSSLGTLLGSAFLDAGKCLKGRDAIDVREAYIFFEAIEKTIMARGHSNVGEKTVLDGLDPAIQVLKDENTWKDGLQKGLETAAAAAQDGSDNTRNLVARHGRMAIRGEQSIGMLDPGSVVAALLVRAFSDTIVKLS